MIYFSLPKDIPQSLQSVGAINSIAELSQSFYELLSAGTLLLS